MLRFPRVEVDHAGVDEDQLAEIPAEGRYLLVWQVAADAHVDDQLVLEALLTVFEEERETVHEVAK